MYSLVLALATGAVALLALFFQTDPKRARTVNFCVIFIGIFAVGSLAYTANLGGQIRHTEFLPVGAEQVGTASPMGELRDKTAH